MRKMITAAAAALLMSSSALAATTQDMSQGWHQETSLLAMEPADSSALIRSVGYQDWSYVDPMMPASAWDNAYAMSGAEPVIQTASSDTVDYQGMGGPLEEVGAEAYPPCDPGPGDDRCIQLYERGVTGQAPTVAGTGGPYEPIAHHDGAMMSSEAHQGVGGPVESQSGYPPCDPGPGDDRCIQLYERGVTGAGN